MQKHPCVVVVTDRVTKRGITGRWITRIKRITEVQIYILTSFILVILHDFLIDNDLSLKNYFAYFTNFPLQTLCFVYIILL